MKCNVVGLKTVSFDTNEGHSEGLKVFVTYEPEDMRNMVGLCADNFYVDLNYSVFGVPDSLKVGDVIELVYSVEGFGTKRKTKLVNILDDKGKPVHCKLKQNYNSV